MARWWTHAATVLLIVGVTALAELAMGRVPWCQCGSIKLWHGVVSSPENSQQVTDWYTFTHILHGVGFYGALWVMGRRLSFGTRFVLAVFLEAAWEVLENTPMVIERYRVATISLDYYGDSVVNSVSDIGAMMVGFWIAHKTDVWVSVALILVLEVMLAVFIRDNLTLNILMLIHPFEAVRRWQTGG